MGLSLQPRHLARYRDIARLLLKYGRSDLVKDLDVDGLVDADLDVPACEDAEQLAADLEALGPTFIKLGQMMSTRVDLLPRPYTDALSRLQDQVAPIPFEDVEQVVTDELGVELRHAFSSFDREPLAAASLAQVHHAVLRSGREVAVKVQRPGIRGQITDDLAALAELARFADDHTSFGRRFGLSDLLEQFRKALLAELDSTREASNLVTLSGILSRWPRLVVPQPVPDYSTSRVLTMDFLPGRKVTELTPLARTDIDGAPLVDHLADPHPGNVLLTPDGRLAVLDVGMVGRLTPGARDHCVRLLLAVSDGNGEGAADAFVGLGTKHEDFDAERFRTATSDLVLRSVEPGSLLQAGTVVLEVTRIAGECGLRPAPEMALVGKALLNLDQVAQSLDPSFAPAEAIRRNTATILQTRAPAARRPAAAGEPARERHRAGVARRGGCADEADPDALQDPRLPQHRHGLPLPWRHSAASRCSSRCCSPTGASPGRRGRSAVRGDRGRAGGHGRDTSRSRSALVPIRPIGSGS